MSEIKKIEIPFSTDQYEERLIVFIDLVGFKDFVFDNYGDGKELVIKKFSEFFQEQVAEGAKFITGNVHSYRPAFTFFSDTIIAAFPLQLYNSPPDMKVMAQKEFPDNPIDIDKFRLLNSASMLTTRIQLKALSFGLLTRGSITIGDIYHNKNTWFGPGLINAYELESQAAIYPRVILSTNALKYFENEITAVRNSAWEKDTDGYYYSNYLSWIHLEFGIDFCKAHHTVRDIIFSNISALIDVGKTRELQKWTWLACFFNRHTDEKLREYHGDALADNIAIT